MFVICLPDLPLGPAVFCPLPWGGVRTGVQARAVRSPPLPGRLGSRDVGRQGLAHPQDWGLHRSTKVCIHRS